MIQQLQTSVPTSSVRRDKRLLLTSLLIPLLFVFFFFFRWAVSLFRYSLSLRFIYELGSMVGLLFQLGLLLVSIIFTSQLILKRKQFGNRYVVLVSLLLSAFPLLYFLFLLLLMMAVSWMYQPLINQNVFRQLLFWRWNRVAFNWVKCSVITTFFS